MQNKESEWPHFVYVIRWSFEKTSLQCASVSALCIPLPEQAVDKASLKYDSALCERLKRKSATIITPMANDVEEEQSPQLMKLCWCLTGDNLPCCTTAFSLWLLAKNNHEANFDRDTPVLCAVDTNFLTHVSLVGTFVPSLVSQFVIVDINQEQELLVTQTGRMNLQDGSFIHCEVDNSSKLQRVIAKLTDKESLRSLPFVTLIGKVVMSKYSDKYINKIRKALGERVIVLSLSKQVPIFEKAELLPNNYLCENALCVPFLISKQTSIFVSDLYDVSKKTIMTAWFITSYVRNGFHEYSAFACNCNPVPKTELNHTLRNVSVKGGKCELFSTKCFFRNVFVFDVFSMYPSCVVNHKLSARNIQIIDTDNSFIYNKINVPENILASMTPTCVDLGNGRNALVYTHLQNYESEVALAISEILVARRRLSKSILVANALKRIANTMYGYACNDDHIFGGKALAMAVTAIARETLHKLIEVVSRSKHTEVIYTDTDSLFVSYPHMRYRNAISKADALAAQINTQFAPVEIKIDNRFAFLIMCVKKRYIGYALPFDTDNELEALKDSTIIYKGIERDTSDFLKSLFSSIAITAAATIIDHKDDITKTSRTTAIAKNFGFQVGKMVTIAAESSNSNVCSFDALYETGEEFLYPAAIGKLDAKFHDEHDQNEIRESLINKTHKIPRPLSILWLAFGKPCRKNLFKDIMSTVFSQINDKAKSTWKQESFIPYAESALITDVITKHFDECCFFKETENYIGVSFLDFNKTKLSRQQILEIEKCICFCQVRGNERYAFLDEAVKLAFLSLNTPHSVKHFATTVEILCRYCSGIGDTTTSASPHLNKHGDKSYSCVNKSHTCGLNIAFDNNDVKSIALHPKLCPTEIKNKDDIKLCVRTTHKNKDTAPDCLLLASIFQDTECESYFTTEELKIVRSLAKCNDRRAESAFRKSTKNYTKIYVLKTAIGVFVVYQGIPIIYMYL